MRRIEFVLCDDCPAPRARQTPEDICDTIRYIDQSTRAQGLSFHVEDPVVLRQIATLLGERPSGSTSPTSPRCTGPTGGDTILACAQTSQVTPPA